MLKYDAAGPWYKERLKKNIEIIQNLSAKEYPALFKYLNAYSGGIKRKLIHLMEVGLEIKRYAEYKRDSDSPGWFFSASIRYLSKRFDGALDSWVHSLAVATLFELLEKRKVPRSGKPQNKGDTKSIKRTLKRFERLNHLRIIPFNKRLYDDSRYCFPYYSEQVLAFADERAQVLLDYGLTTGRVSAESLNLIFGKEVANQAYADMRRLKDRSLKAMEELTFAVKMVVGIKGYAYPSDVVYEAQGDAAYLRKKWEQLEPIFLHNLGLIKSCPSREEKELLGLTSGAHIIRYKT